MKPVKFLSACLSGALALGLCLAPAGAASFTDTVGHVAEEAISLFADLKILEGDGNGHFFPDQSITRGDLCTILNRVFTYTESVPNTFPDLDESMWYAEPMLKLCAAGIVQGDGTGIRPLDTIRWDEALVMIARAFGIEEQPDGVLPFPVDSWAAGYVSALLSAGYLPSDQIDPAAPFTRADTVTILNNIISDLGWSSAGKVLILKQLVPILEGVATSHYDRDSFYEADGRIYYDDGVTPVTYGIDVSTHQNEIDWNAVAADGIDFAIIRLGYRGYGQEGTLNLDKYFEQNINGALAAGLDVGVYFFSQAITAEEAVEEANFVLQYLEGYDITYPVVFDWENVSTTSARTHNLDSATLNACAVAFCDTIAAAGYQPMVYFNGYLGLLRYDLSAIDDYPFWYAYYNGVYPNLYYDFQMWQYSSSGSVAGIEGKVDLNICFGGQYGQSHGGTIPPREEEAADPSEPLPEETTPPEETAPAETEAPEETPSFTPAETDSPSLDDPAPSET